jgi:hypothetical protein
MTDCILPGLESWDPLWTSFARAMELLCQLGLAQRREVDMEPEEGQMVRKRLRRR